MSDPKAWVDALPMTGNLPEVYRENEVAQWLSTPWDKFLYGLKAKIDEIFLRQLDPETCDHEWLDYLAALSGFVGDYWDARWDEGIKRTLIKQGLGFLWVRRGTRGVLDFVLKLFLGNQFDIWTESEFRADVTPLDAELGEPEFRYFIRLPLTFLRGGEEFRLAERINRLYGAFYCDSEVIYDGFYADFSTVGDPVFDDGDFIGGGLEE